MIMKCMQALRAAVPRPGPRRTGRTRRRTAAFLCWAGLAAAGASPAPALALPVTLDTSALAGTSARLEFVLLDGDAAANNSVRVSGLYGGTPAGFDCSVGCTGGPPFVLDDSIGLGQLLYDLTLGDSVSFDLSYTTNYAGVPGTDPPDRFALSLLDPATNFTLVLTDITFPGDALLTIDLIGAGVVQAAGPTTPRDRPGRSGTRLARAGGDRARGARQAPCRRHAAHHRRGLMQPREKAVNTRNPTSPIRWRAALAALLLLAPPRRPGPPTTARRR